ncbi:glutamyl aminopeptidase isoform X3 [Manduca sexta]|uniref:glutamyl aminopeptidase isoform X3 n=1 Tax=Manduca sexta TaxID=7130 RepID=UPI00188E67CF|nr:glutamyl aminopeptidase isoform X3 [Manduca sexta]
MPENVLKCACKNKLLVLLGLLSFCLLISTISLLIKNTDCQGSSGGDSKNKDVSPAEEEHVIDYYRLPRNVIPKNYKLVLSPNMTSNMFEGIVTITLRVLERVETITLHSNKLNIQELTLWDFNNQMIPIKSTNMSFDAKEMLHILLKRSLNPEYYKLEIKFHGKLINKIVGLYASHLKNNGTMVASKFQPTYARQAFPCFDEPDFKATYDIALVKPPSYKALSNMNEISKSFDPTTNMDTVKFATSVPMSTYLACFVVCDFDFKETVINSNGIGKNFTLRSFAQKGETHKIDFAQDIGQRATEFYIKYYEVPFPLPKLDMIAIPDYVSGATEHWGLITYRETSFLVDNATASSKNKISVANTIAHELAHMWFGNLVTMKWWDEVWLNEGFASYLQVKSLNALEPSWSMLDQFLTKTLHPVLDEDAKLSSHPIVQTVATPDQITAIFDRISYNKGASVLRMLEGFVGEENFRQGVSDYLKKHEFGNTVTQDLLNALSSYFKKNNPNLNLTHIMNTWTRQMGYPVLSVRPADKPNTYEITQSRFLYDKDAKYTNDSSYNYRWFVPITYKTDGRKSENILWFPDSVDKVTLTLENDAKWLKINNDQVGYYRVHYTNEMWQNLIEQLLSNPTQLTISDRAHLLDDAFALAEAEILPYEIALNLSKYLVKENDYVPWEAASSILLDLSGRLLNSLAYEDFQKYAQGLLKPLYDKQSWDKKNINVIDGLLRTRILSLATRFEVADAEAKVRSLFLNWLHNHGTPNAIEIEPDLRDFVYYYGMKSSSQEEWDKLWNIYLNETDVQESAKLRHALSGPRDTNILRRFLLLAWDERNIRSQDYLTVLHQISSNPSGTALVWDDVRTRWGELVHRFTLNSRYLGNLIPAITSSFNTELKLKEVKENIVRKPVHLRSSL